MSRVIPVAFRSTAPPAGGFDKSELQAWWSFDSVRTDSHTGGFDLDLLSLTVPYNTTTNHIGSGAAQVADLTGFTLSNAASPTPPSSEFTVSGWVKATSTAGGSTWRGIIGKDRDVSGELDQRSWTLWFLPHSTRPIFGISTTGGSSINTSTGTEIPQLGVGNWAHLHATFEQGVARTLWVNGVLEDYATSSTGTAIFNSAAPINIGDACREDGSRFFPGEIDELSIWNRVIKGGVTTEGQSATAESELGFLYNAGVGRTYGEL